MPASDPDTSAEHAVVPVVEETLTVGRRTVETGRVVVRSEVEERTVQVSEALARTDADVRRVPVDREVEVAPEPHWEGDVLIVPVVEEFLFVEKRLRVVEELHVVRRTGVNRAEQSVPLRRTRVTIERREGAGARPDISSEGKTP